MKKMAKYIAFRATPEFFEKLDKIARELNTSKSDLIRIAVSEFIRRVEKRRGEEL